MISPPDFNGHRDLHIELSGSFFFEPEDAKIQMGIIS